MGRETLAGGLVSLAFIVAPLTIEQADAGAPDLLHRSYHDQEQQWEWRREDQKDVHANLRATLDDGGNGVRFLLHDDHHDDEDDFSMSYDSGSYLFDDDEPLCSNGLWGVESPGGSVCCPASCGECGGEGCASRGTEADCCVGAILDSGDACSETESAPCFIDDRASNWLSSSLSSSSFGPVPTPSPTIGSASLEKSVFDGTCSNGVWGVESPGGSVCCPAACGECGGEGCSSRVSESTCCVGEIQDSGVFCSTSGTAPCVIDDSSASTDDVAATAVPAADSSIPWTTFSDGVCHDLLGGVEAPGGFVCCLASCGECGGEDCASRGEASDCCEEDIWDEGESCSVTGVAPCFIDDDVIAMSPSAPSPARFWSDDGDSSISFSYSFEHN